MSNLFMTPITILSNVGKIASKLNDFYNLSTEDIKKGLRENATPKNIAYAAFATTAVSSALIYPPTRIAICTALSLSYSFTVIALNLVILGLYLSIAGAKGLSSAAGFMTAPLQDLMKGVQEGMNGPSMPQTAPKSPKIDEVIETPAPTTTSQTTTPSKVEEPMNRQETSNPAAVEQETFDTAWKETQKQQKIDNMIPDELAQFDDVWDEIMNKNSAPVTHKLSELKDGNRLYDELGIKRAASTSSQMVEQFTKTSQKNNMPLPSQESLVKEFTNWRHSSPQVGKWVNEFQAEQMAEEFLAYQQKTKSSLLKPLMIGAGAGVALFATYKAYKAYQDYQKQEITEEPEKVDISYVNIDREELPEIEESYRSDLYDNWGLFSGLGEEDYD